MESRSYLMKKIKQWLCSVNIHWIKILEGRGLRGPGSLTPKYFYDISRQQALPKYATHVIRCTWCNKIGYRYLFNGSWSNTVK